MQTKSLIQIFLKQIKEKKREKETRNEIGK